MANWISTSWWPSIIAAIGVVLLLLFVSLRYRQSRRLELLFVLAGFVLFAVGYFMEAVKQTYDVRELPNGMLELIPRPWKAVCESIVILGHGCIFVGLCGLTFPKFVERIELLKSKLTSRVPGA